MIVFPLTVQSKLSIHDFRICIYMIFNSACQYYRNSGFVSQFFCSAKCVMQLHSVLLTIMIIVQCLLIMKAWFLKHIKILHLENDFMFHENGNHENDLLFN